MYFRLVSFFKFLFRSTNQHGVHSPFVFDYITECLYQKPRKSKDKTLNVLFKSISYFKLQKIELSHNSKYKNQLTEAFPNLVFNEHPFDMVYLEHPDETYIAKLLGQNKLHNDSVLFMGNIHKNADYQKNWRNLAAMNSFTVSIDLFCCGVLFLRKEQVKEHFTIRI